MPAGPDWKVLGLELAYELAQWLPAQSTGQPGAPYTYGKEIKSHQFTELPEKQFNVRSTGGFITRGQVISNPTILVEVRDVSLPGALIGCKWIIGLLDKQMPSLPSLAMLFYWQSHETFYREQNRRIMVPLYFTTLGTAKLV